MIPKCPRCVGIRKHEILLTSNEEKYTMYVLSIGYGSALREYLVNTVNVDHCVGG